MPSWKVILQFSREKNDSDQQEKHKDRNALERAKWRLKNAFFLFLIDLPDSSSFKLVSSFSYLYYLFENFV